MNNGWIKLHRKFEQWEWFNNSQMVHLFLYFLLHANHEEGRWRGQVINRGQFVTGLESLSKTTGISVQSLRTCINRLKSTGEITNKSTNKFRIITIINYDEYQKDDRKSTSKLTYNLTNNQQATNNQSTANKNDKNVRTKELSEQSSQEIVSIINAFKEVNPSYRRWFGNTTQRGACERLITTHGVERVLKVIAVLPKSNRMEYVPTITTPVQLEDKWAALESALIKKKSEYESKLSKNKVAFS